MKRESPLEVWRWSLNTEDYWRLNTARHWTACSPAASDKCLKLNSKCYCWLSTTPPLFSPLIQLNIRNRNTLKNQYFYFEIFISSLFLFLMITIWRINSPPCPSFVIIHQNVAFTLIVFFSVLLWSLPSSVWVQLILSCTEWASVLLCVQSGSITVFTTPFSEDLQLCDRRPHKSVSVPGVWAGRPGLQFNNCRSDEWVTAQREEEMKEPLTVRQKRERSGCLNNGC